MDIDVTVIDTGAGDKALEVKRRGNARTKGINGLEVEWPLDSFLDEKDERVTVSLAKICSIDARSKEVLAS